MIQNLKVLDMNTDNQECLKINRDVAVVSDVKTVIANVGLATYEDQILYFQCILLHDDEQELSNYRIKDEDILHLYRKTKAPLIKVKVLRPHPFRYSFTVDLPGLARVASLRVIINRETGVPSARQRLWAKGVEMRDNDAVRDYTHTQELTVAMTGTHADGRSGGTNVA